PAASHGAAAPVFRGTLSDCPGFASLKLAPLPGSRREAEEIAAIWKRAGRPGASSQAVLLTGTSAGEAAVKALAPGKRVLHFATHGFFISASCDSTAVSHPAATRGIGAMRPSSESPAREVPHHEPNPLRLAGLALAGANHRAAGDSSRDDGILTAEE